ncbi:MAG: vWA domain-containing protein [Thermogutta sp.]
MTFGAAAFLLAALAAIIPPILHMINRQRAKQLPFSTLRFLKISVQKTRRRRQIRDLFLMLLRMTVLILIAIGLARPTLNKIRSFMGGGQSALAIVLDNSASMGWIDQGRPRFDLAVNAANQILNELQMGDEVTLWVTSGPRYPEIGQVDRTHDKVRQLLGQIAQRGPTFERGELGHLVREARNQLLQSQSANRYVFVITDNQAVAWEDLFIEQETKTPANESEKTADPRLRRIPVVVIDCHRNPKPNVAIRKVELSTVLPVAGIPMKVIVELFNGSSIPQQRVAELYVDGTKMGSSPEVSLAPQSSAVTEIVFTLTRGGTHQAEVRLSGEDGASFDNRRYFALEVNANIPIAIVTQERHEIPYLNDSFYLEKALQPLNEESWALKPIVFTAANLTNEPLSNYRIIYLVDLPEIDQVIAKRLLDFVETGGKLVWICGQDTQIASYNAADETTGGKLLPEPLDTITAPGIQDNRDSWQIAWLDAQHPALVGLNEPPSLYQSVLVYKYIKTRRREGSEARVLARLDGEGSPIILERRVGQGSVIWLGTSVHVDWTNFPLRPLFVPLMTRLAFYLSGTEPETLDVLAGQPIVIPFQGQMPPSVVEVVPPDGSLSRLNVEAGRSTDFRYAETHAVGIYLFRLLASVRPVQKIYAVNPDPDESDSEKIPREQLEQAFSESPVIFAEDPENLSATFALLRHGRSLSELFLTMVLIGLVFETFISNWFSPKEDQQPGLLSQYRPTRRLSRLGK